MVDDLSDVYAEIRRLKQELRRARTPIRMEDSSISEGQFRVADGATFHIDEGGTVDVDGGLNVRGNGRVELSQGGKITATDITRLWLVDEAVLRVGEGDAWFEIKASGPNGVPSIEFTPDNGVTRTRFRMSGNTLFIESGDSQFGISPNEVRMRHGDNIARVNEDGTYVTLRTDTPAGMANQVVVSDGALYRGAAV
ncbi:hypothetical protein [Microbacterium sp. KNMS]